MKLWANIILLLLILVLYSLFFNFQRRMFVIGIWKLLNYSHILVCLRIVLFASLPDAFCIPVFEIRENVESENKNEAKVTWEAYLV